MPKQEQAGKRARVPEPEEESSRGEERRNRVGVSKAGRGTGNKEEGRREDGGESLCRTGAYSTYGDREREQIEN
ncbi:hypothetical protein EVG20_g8169 [Dentipellis fragilis]|uniref:Uncharacterized protein n=1 Tax=Dentipellis fragilis TaxID=205917 RepID=A0A4Y9Y922_9AGAM|nr:hypothetical protein EVG20_g8169 [Dentipellis fragilis]